MCCIIYVEINTYQKVKINTYLLEILNPHAVTDLYLSLPTFQTGMGTAENLSPNIVHRRNPSASSSTSSSSLTKPANEDTSPSLDHAIASSDPIFNQEHSTLDLSKTETQLKESNLSHEDELKKLKEIGAKTPILPSQIGTDFNFKREVVWSNAIGFAALHLCAVTGVILGLFLITDLRTSIYGN